MRCAYLKFIFCLFAAGCSNVNNKPVDNNFKSKLIHGKNLTCSLSDESLSCWVGNNRANILMKDDSSYSSIKLGYSSVCGLDRSDRLKCWSKKDNSFFREKMEQIDKSEYLSISVGYFHGCGITKKNQLKCWGQNDYGQLGIEKSELSRSVPVEVDSSANYQKVVSGNMHSCGLTSLGTVKCWGSNSLGQFGDIERKSYFSPQKIGEDFSFVDIMAEEDYTCAAIKKKDNELENKVICFGEKDGLRFVSNETKP